MDGVFMNKGLLLIIIIPIIFSAFGMEFDKECVNESDSTEFAADRDIIWREKFINFDQKRWITKFSFLNAPSLPHIVKRLVKIPAKNENICGNKYVTPQIIIGLMDESQCVTICGNKEECVVIRYEKSIKETIGNVSSSLIDLKYISMEELNSLILWADDKEEDIPLNDELTIKELFCCCIDQQMAVVHQLEGDEQALVIIFRDTN